ncbi:hypothetical protein LWI28_014301 [Acer negundo]|uniref:Uncharacterized protein n=1 Tax=Acer negundo TaxID=4023 RepID=A0AAD5J5Z0_ACENE|nr:hypothetical protein LWI28_014301 [Acer negundo]
MVGFDPKTAIAIVMSLGFWLLKGTVFQGRGLHLAAVKGQNIGSSELGLKRFHHFLIQLECFCQNIRVNGGIRYEYGVSDGDDTRVLAAQTGKGNCIGFSNIEL